MSDKQSSHPLYQNQQAQHPLSDQPPEQPQPRGIAIPIPLNAKQPYLTYALIAINVGIFLIRYFLPALSNQILLAGYTDSVSVLEQGQYYRLLTSMFLHFNVMHVAFNSVALYYIGSNVERFFGHARFALVYFLGGLFGSILPLFFNSGGLGASGAVFAVWGAEVVFLYQNREIFGATGRSRIRSSLMLMLVNFILGFSANAVANVADSPIRIGNSAHFGGLLGGMLIAWILSPRFAVQRKTEVEAGEIPIEIIQTNRLQDQLISIAAICIGLLALLMLAFFLHS